MPSPTVDGWQEPGSKLPEPERRRAAALQSLAAALRHPSAGQAALPTI